jgi:hypothetical protein
MYRLRRGSRVPRLVPISSISRGDVENQPSTYEPPARFESSSAQAGVAVGAAAAHRGHIQAPAPALSVDGHARLGSSALRSLAGPRSPRNRVGHALDRPGQTVLGRAGLLGRRLSNSGLQTGGRADDPARPSYGARVTSPDGYCAFSEQVRATIAVHRRPLPRPWRRARELPHASRHQRR